ncbi:MAG: DUF4082 domain-containing protein [Bacteroidota bacterium]|nr:DUF4082 domain-containing protein [Bacteroidota bacterium]
MKRIFYPFISLFFSATLICGISSKAQTFTILNPVSAPPGGPGGQANTNDFPAFTAIQGIETGIRFKVTQLGTINAIRFYKGTLNTGTHIGNIWDPAFSTVTPRATVTFTGETASGWQQMSFGTPFTAVPGVVYVASVFSPTGTYAFEDGSGAINPSFDITNPPFIILAGDGAGGTDIGNGTWLYTASSAYPTNPFGSGYSSTNYFVDVVFAPTFPLPVVLSEFRATPSNSDVLLSWKTQSEFNSRGFEIQRSNNSADWYPVNFVNGAGESTTTRNYSYTDKGLAPGLYYYRLRQTDYDGKNTFSSIVTAIIGGKGTVSLFPNYPNPFSATSTIRYDLPRTQKVRLSLVDMMGREVKVLADNMSEAGSHLVTIDAATLQRQLYLVRLQTDDGTVLTQRILVE